MNGKTRSILLQVAFKEGVQLSLAQGDLSPSNVEEKTIQMYETLLSLHEKYSIEPDEGGGRGGRSSSSTPRTPAGNEFGIKFEVDGIEYLDFRAAKDSGKVKPGFPDFKTADGSKIFAGGTKNGSWLEGREGPDLEAHALAKAADLVAALS